MKDLGVLKYFLGVEVACSRVGLFLSRRKYALDIISEAGLMGARPMSFSMEQNHRLDSSTSPLLCDVERFRRSLEAALRVVKYLKGCPGQGILLGSDSDLHLTGWCDSDWASCPLTRRSVSGWIVFLGSSPVS
ncbi:hypothetical protein LIER_33505 [Lithospermum erythrorhizon]|uniref:Uncharacterized protein n=1 Tax=Lithospermum erythrorhizon TaxID=34254 RepID=A0AAV3RYB5_LITER